MKEGGRYLLRRWDSPILIEVECLEVSQRAFKVKNVIQNTIYWMQKTELDSSGGYEIFEILKQP